MKNLTIHSLVTACSLAGAFACAGCGSASSRSVDTGSAADSVASPVSQGGSPLGIYVLSAFSGSDEWINATNFHKDGSFEATLGIGLTNGTLNVDGTYGFASGILTLHASDGSTHAYAYRLDGSDLKLTYRGGTPSDNAEFTLQPGPRPATIDFQAGAKGTPTPGGAIPSGGIVLIEYAAARNACSDGSQVTKILGSVDGGQPFLIDPLPTAFDGQLRYLLNLAPSTAQSGSDLALWFENLAVNNQGDDTCTTWDSNGGFDINYHFTVD